MYSERFGAHLEIGGVKSSHDHAIAPCSMRDFAARTAALHAARAPRIRLQRAETKCARGAAPTSSLEPFPRLSRTTQTSSAVRPAHLLVAHHPPGRSPPPLTHPPTAGACPHTVAGPGVRVGGVAEVGRMFRGGAGSGRRVSGSEGRFWEGRGGGSMAAVCGGRGGRRSGRGGKQRL